jgi:predicted 3-demethylubiquinone-9 3-methyltransferase (glyoxalase superfamily)
MAHISKIHPHLWYEKNAEEAARLYVSIFPNSKIDKVWIMAGDSPSGPEGSVKVVEFTLFGSPFMAMEAGPLDAFNHAISFMVECDSQDEVDTYWNKLLEGGSAEPCGWLKDRYGVSWQITPRSLNIMMADDDKAKARRVAAAMMKMQKLDKAALERAFAGS